MTLPLVLEALLFASAKPLSLPEMRAALKSAAEFTEEPLAAALAGSPEAEIHRALGALAGDYRQSGRAFSLVETAAGWQMTTTAPLAPWVRQLYPESKPTHLTAPALETLSIIAYRQPIARADIEAVRGVDVGGVVQTLLERGLIRIAGRALEVPGRPILYATTEFFMDHFGLKSIDELPNHDELRRIPLPTAPPKETAKTAKAAQPARPAGEPSDKGPVTVAGEVADTEEEPPSSEAKNGAGVEEIVKEMNGAP